MRVRRYALAIVFAWPVFTAAAEPSDVLRYIPKQADAALIVDRPRLLADALMHFEPLRQLAAFDAVKEQLASTNSKRLINLIAYYEKRWANRGRNYWTRWPAAGRALPFALMAISRPCCL